MDFNVLTELLYIEPTETYNFSEDDILLLKLTHNINVEPINGVNPFICGNTEEGDTLVCFHEMLDLFMQIIRNDPDHLSAYSQIYCFLRNVDEHYFKTCPDKLTVSTLLSYTYQLAKEEGYT